MLMRYQDAHDGYESLDDLITFIIMCAGIVAENARIIFKLTKKNVWKII